LKVEPREIRFGVENYDGPEKQTILGMLKTPLGK
jgi:hypothetical protein